MAAPIPKARRLEILLERLAIAPAAQNPDDALATMNCILDEVEDEFSGVKMDPNPGLAATDRMYPAQPDRIVHLSDGTIVATMRGHIAIFGPRGSIEIIDRASTQTIFRKPGG